MSELKKAPAFWSAPRIRELQEARLRELMHYLETHSPFYRQHFAQHQVDAKKVHSLEDLQRLPTTSKDDLQARNEDFLCIPAEKVVEYTSTSGTLGRPVSIALSDKDLDRLAYNEFRSFECIGAGPGDLFQLMLTLDRQFMAGMAYYLGIRKLGGGILRVGPGVPAMQWETILRYRPTVIVGVPSFIYRLMEFAREHRIDLRQNSVRKAFLIGENIRNTDFSLNLLGQKIRQSWDLELFSTYASTEMQTAFTECSQGQGGHLQPDLLILEVLDESGLPVQDGQPGEVTITTLGVEAMPLLRYRTGDICVAHTATCSCGRNSLRLSGVLGRKKQMIKFKGTTLYAPALFDLLHGMEEIQDYQAEVYSNEIGTDEVLLHLVARSSAPEADHKIRAYLQAKLRVSPHIRYVSQEEMTHMQSNGSSRKPIRFVDRREGPRLA